jgi:hypothetical protein
MYITVRLCGSDVLAWVQLRQLDKEIGFRVSTKCPLCRTCRIGRAKREKKEKQLTVHRTSLPAAHPMRSHAIGPKRQKKVKRRRTTKCPFCSLTNDVSCKARQKPAKSKRTPHYLRTKCLFCCPSTFRKEQMKPGTGVATRILPGSQAPRLPGCKAEQCNALSAAGSPSSALAFSRLREILARSYASRARATYLTLRNAPRPRSRQETRDRHAPHLFVHQ